MATRASTAATNNATMQAILSLFGTLSQAEQMALIAKLVNMAVEDDIVEQAFEKFEQEQLMLQEGEALAAKFSSSKPAEATTAETPSVKAKTAEASAEATTADEDWGTPCSVSSEATIAEASAEATSAETPSVKAPIAEVEEKSKAEAPIADVCGHYLTIGLNCLYGDKCTKLHPYGLENSVKPLKSLKTKKDKKPKAQKPCWHYLTEGQTCYFGSKCRKLHPSGKENSLKPKASAADDAAS